jgi:O-acetyl-ADP-ribose deacetylase (regulator of RNase III)
MRLIKGDITQETSGLIIHGCNTVGGFGSGVAGAVRRKWPQVHHRFSQMGTGKHLLGTLDIVKIDDNLFIGNGYTQETCGYDGQRYASPEAIDRVLQKAFVYCHLNNIQLKSPMIGSGLGGLDWETEVKPLFEKYEQIYNTEVNIYYI